MKAIVYRRYGGPEVLEYTDVPDPKLAHNSVLVRVPGGHAIQSSGPSAASRPGRQPYRCLVPGDLLDGMSLASSSAWVPGFVSLRRGMR